MQPWENLLADPQVHLRNPDDENFKHFVQKLLPRILGEELLRAKVYASTLMHAQYRILRALALVESNNRGEYKAEADRLSIWPFAESALRMKGYSPEDFFRLVPGFTEPEIAAINRAETTIRDVLNNRPAVLLRSLLQSQSKYRH
jgi:hypothetical protein